MVLATASGPQVVAHHGRSEAVEIGHHDAALDASGDLVDEPRQAGVTAQPEDRHLRAEPCHVVESTHGVGDGPRMRWVIEEHRRAIPVEVLQVSGRLTIGHHQHDGLRVGVPAQVTTRQRQRVMQVRALLVDTLQAGQFGGCHRPGVTAKGDDLQRI